MRVAVVGAANSAVDVALETYRKGAKEVTMIIREPSLSDSVKYWVKPDVENRIEEGEDKEISLYDAPRLRAKKILASIRNLK